MEKVTIIVLTYNSERTIEKCLEAIRRQDFPKDGYSTIIIDGGSKDNTLSIVEKFKYPIYVFRDLTISALRNKGVEISRTPIVAFVDSDCEIASDWLLKGLKWFNDGRPIGMVGFKYRLPSPASCVERSWHGELPNEISEKSLIPAGNIFISKTIFERLGGFDPTLITGEDAYLEELARKKGYLTISDPEIKNVHYGNPKSIKQFYKKEVWYGIGGSSIIQKIRHFEKPFLVSNFILIVLMVLIYGTCTLNLMLMLASVGTFVTTSILCALDRRFGKKIKGNFWHMTVLYAVYLLARVNSLTYIYGIRRLTKRIAYAISDRITRDR